MDLEERRWKRGFAPSDRLLVVTAAFAGFLVLGYHPFAEDGGIYVAAIAARMDPSLFPAGHEWVEGHTRLAFFVPVVAWVSRLIALPLRYGLLLLQAAGLLALVAAGLQLARLCFAESSAAGWAPAMLAVAAGLPVAGTSLYLVDPYVTARTLTTPLLLWALCAVLEGRMWMAAGLWAAAALLHPLMAGWGLVPMLFVLCLQRRQSARWCAGLAGVVVVVAGCVWGFSPADAPLVHTLAETRGYWFVGRWAWYEWVGAVAPLVLLGWMARGQVLLRIWTRAGREALMACCSAGSLMLVVAFLFAAVPGRSTALARVQPLRTLHEVYCVFVLLLGGACLRWVATRWGVSAGVAVIGFVGLAMLLGQRAIYPSSGQFEFPWSPPVNAWEQAFVWIRGQTPRDASFALDADYTVAAGEDAQGFRALALRSMLPDRAKDGGIASVMPGLAADWAQGVKAQTGLDGLGDEELRGRLAPLGVSWVVLPVSQHRRLPCPYRNAVVEVCRLK